MGKIGTKGNLSPRSQRLLGGLSGAKYKDIKADFIPSERAKAEAAARAKRAAEEKARKAQAGSDEEGDDTADFEGALSPTTILRRARKTSSAAKTQMAEAQNVLASSSKLIAEQFKGMSERKLRERIKITFDTYDVSGDGLLQVDELHGALTGLGQSVSMDEAAKFVAENGSYLEGAPVKPGQEPDELTFDDFERVIRRMLFGDEHEISRLASAEVGEDAASEGPDVPVTPNAKAFSVSVSKAAAGAGLAVRTGSNSTVTPAGKTGTPVRTSSAGKPGSPTRVGSGGSGGAPSRVGSGSKPGTPARVGSGAKRSG